MREQSRTRVRIDERTLTLTSLEKVMFAGSDTTKGELLHYYLTVAPRLLPLLAGRPVTRVRWPHGTGGPSFFEKNLPSGAPHWLPRVTIGDVTYPLVTCTADLIYLANLNSIEFHVPQWRVTGDGGVGRPDRMVIDLDPGKPAGIEECAVVALLIKNSLGAAGSDLLPVSSGSKGLQLYTSLDNDLSSDKVSEIVCSLAQALSKGNPERIVWKMTKSVRSGKVLIDWSQNNAAKTTICPYSLRGRDIPTAAAPRSWHEINQLAWRSALFTPDANPVKTQAAQHSKVLRQLTAEDVLERLT